MAGSELLPAMRLRDWQSRLAACVAEHQAKPFAWGSNDCATFAAACVKAVTGEDRLSDISWSTDRDALSVLNQNGGLAAMASKRLGDEINPSMAQPGDIGITVQNGRDALCVCGGMHWHGPAAEGLATFAPEQVISAWRCEVA
jgi:hypothetical protein